MLLISHIVFNGELFEGIGNNMAGAFCFTDTLECRSVATWQVPNPPYWEGYWHFVIVANENGEEISFKIYDEETDSIYGCIDTIIFENDTTIGTPYEPFILSCGQVGIDDNIDMNDSKLNLINYPNPITPEGGSRCISGNLTTTISYTLPNSGHVRLIVYNVKGQLVETLVNNYQEADNYKINWDASKLSSGIYFYKLTCRENSIVKRCLIMK